MVFCHGCGKQIHETAPSCPGCGAIQSNAADRDKHHWSSIVSLISGIIVFLLLLTEPDGNWDNETIVGVMIFGAIPISFGLYSFSQLPKNDRWMGATGLILGIMVVLIALGSK